MDLFWRENLICPTEEEYIAMVNNSTSCLFANCRATIDGLHQTETGGLFRIAIKLMMTSSASDVYAPAPDLLSGTVLTWCEQ